MIRVLADPGIHEGEGIRAWGKVKGVFLCSSRYRPWAAIRNIQG